MEVNGFPIAFDKGPGRLLEDLEETFRFFLKLFPRILGAGAWAQNGIAQLTGGFLHPLFCLRLEVLTRDASRSRTEVRSIVCRAVRRVVRSRTPPAEVVRPGLLVSKPSTSPHGAVLLPTSPLTMNEFVHDQHENLKPPDPTRSNTFTQTPIQVFVDARRACKGDSREMVGTDVGVVVGCNDVPCAEPRSTVYAATQACKQRARGDLAV